MMSLGCRDMGSGDCKVEGHSHGYGAGTWAGWRDIVMGMVQGAGT